jgi:tetratricopeptide (TPR) repeat protein
MINVPIDRWTGVEARLLRQALRLSVRGFAEHTGIAARTLARWEKSDTATQLRPDSQAVLDTTLARASTEAQALFALLLDQAAPRVIPGTTDLAATPPVPSASDRSGPPSGGPLGSRFDRSLADDGDLLAELDSARRRIAETLTDGGAKPRLDVIEERIADHLAVYTRSSPTEMLQPLLYDIHEIHELVSMRQTALAQARLSESTSILSVLVADALMKLGEISRASYWYSTARTAADDTHNSQLRALARAQEAMLPYYFGGTERAVDLARTARALSPSPNDTMALATAAEARGLAKLGDQDGARSALSAAWDLVESLEPLPADRAFQFDDKRLFLYASSTLTHLGDTARAREVQRQALDKYDPHTGSIIDPALIRLDAAVCAGKDGDLDEACGVAAETLTSLPDEHRTEIVIAKAKAVVPAIPPRHHGHRAVEQLRELLTEHGHGWTA